MRNMLSSAYLTSRQLDIWESNRRGKSRAEIGERYGFTRQAVYDSLKVSLRKVEFALRHTAEASSIEILRVDPINGILLGKVPLDSNKIIITFSRKHGVQTWHFEEPDCNVCGYMKRCMERLIDEAEERNIELEVDQRRLSPSKLAHVIFSKLIPELGQ